MRSGRRGYFGIDDSDEAPTPPSTRGDPGMATKHDVTENIVYDIVSIQYHALQAVNSYQSYLDDAHSAEHGAVTEFIEECRQQDLERARRCHELLVDLTSGA
jgi:hypothetical protein